MKVLKAVVVWVGQVVALFSLLMGAVLVSEGISWLMVIAG